MKYRLFKNWITLLSVLFFGCAQSPNLPLVFGQKHSVGLTINGSTTEQSAELTLGYKDKDFAIIPVKTKMENY